jgi:ATP phosphoribosyltransferase
VIVDITTTGATLRDNGLKILEDGVILKSQAQLAASLTADWNTDARKACDVLLSRLDKVNPLYKALAAQLPG